MIREQFFLGFFPFGRFRSPPGCSQSCAARSGPLVVWSNPCGEISWCLTTMCAELKVCVDRNLLLGVGGTLEGVWSDVTVLGECLTAHSWWEPQFAVVFKTIWSSVNITGQFVVGPVYPTFELSLGYFVLVPATVVNCWYYWLISALVFEERRPEITKNVSCCSCCNQLNTVILL